MSERKERWHLDKRVPVLLLLGFLTQPATFGWFIRGQSDDIEMLKIQVADANVRILASERRLRKAEVSGAEITTKLNHLDRLLNRSLDKIDRIERYTRPTAGHSNGD